MNLRRGITIAFVVVACLLVIGWVKSSKDEEKAEKANEGKCAIEAIMTRTSVRSFMDKKVSKDTVEIILKAGMAAPTGMNAQPWAFIVVDDEALLKELADSLPNAKMTADAAFAIVACGDTTKMLDGVGREYWIQDVSAATENMLVAVNALKLGAVWTGVYPKAERMEKVAGILGMPSHLIPLNLIPVGYPSQTPEPKNKWKAENVFYNSFKEAKAESK